MSPPINISKDIVEVSPPISSQKILWKCLYHLKRYCGKCHHRLTSQKILWKCPHLYHLKRYCESVTTYIISKDIVKVSYIISKDIVKVSPPINISKDIVKVSPISSQKILWKCHHLKRYCEVSPPINISKDIVKVSPPISSQKILWKCPHLYHLKRYCGSVTTD